MFFGVQYHLHHVDTQHVALNNGMHPLLIKHSYKCYVDTEHVALNNGMHPLLIKHSYKSAHKKQLMNKERL